LVADSHHRVERVHRALEDHRDVPPTEAANLLVALADEVFTAEDDAPARDAPRRTQDLHDGVRDGRLAAPRLAGEPEDLALVDVQVDAVDCPRTPVLDRQRAELEQRRRIRSRLDRGFHHNRHVDVLSVRSRGLLISSIPASSSTSPSTVKASAAPGKKNGHHSPCSTVELTCAQYSVTPQLVTDWSPRPRNSRPASVRSAM